MNKFMTRAEYQTNLRNLVDLRGRLVQAQEAYDRQFFALMDQSALFPVTEVTL